MKKLDLPEEEICEKYLNGMSAIKIAKEYGCAKPTINDRLRKME